VNACPQELEGFAFMHKDLKNVAAGLGDFIHSSKEDLVRNGEDNHHWKEHLKERCLLGIKRGFESLLPNDVGVRLIETPYNSAIIGRGDGKNEMHCHHWRRPNARRTITVLVDIVDGSWNAACGLPWSASTMLALTEITASEKPADELVLDDFKCGIIVPLVGGVAAPKGDAGFYYGVSGEAPRFRLAHTATEFPLHPTPMDDVRQTRFFLDLFTAQSYETLSIALEAVKPLIRDWADFGRFYGAGIELMSLLARPGITPGFGGYVAANQKADNLIPTKMLLEGAGVIVTNWWGEPIDQMKVMDRVYVAIGASKPLHDHMLRHLSKTVQLP
jgi:fructose-1,6-bisphosphatase/inositol monophosphatase family enzyme